MIIWTRKAKKDLMKLPKDLQERILKALRELDRFDRGDVKPLVGDMKGYFRLRVGEWRVLFRYKGQDIEVERVLHRRDAYR